MNQRDERVYQALWSGRSNPEEVCLPIAEIRAVTGLDDSQVRAAQGSLCNQGLLQFTGRRFRKTAVFKILPLTPGAQQPGSHLDWSPLQGSPDQGEPDLGSDWMPQGSDSSVASADKLVRNLERWVKSTGIHFDREPEVEEEIFGPHGVIRRMTSKPHQAQTRQALLKDEELKARLLALWRGHRPTGVKLEREQLERLQRKAEPKPIPVEEPERPGPEVLVEVLTEQTSRNGQEPEWPDLPTPEF
jgi:hypothetical protein